MSLLCRFTKPLSSFNSVLRSAFSAIGQDAHAELSFGMTLLGCHAKPAASF